MMNNMLDRLLGSSFIHPLLFAIFPVTFIFVNNLDFVSKSDFFTSLAIMSVFTAIVWSVLKVITTNIYKSSIALSALLLLSFTYGHFHNLIVDFTGEYIRNIFLIPFFLFIFLLIIFFLTKSSHDFKNLNKIINGVSITIVLISLVHLVPFYAFDPSTDDGISNISSNTIINSTNLPDVYYIILDAYASESSLMEFYGFDNGDFVNSLESRGFVVIDDSHSNYAWSYLSIGSSLNMNYHEFDEQLGEKNYGLAYDLISHNLVMQNFKLLGYEIFNLNSGWGPTRTFDISDHDLCGKANLIGDSPIIISILDNSILKPIYSILLVDDKRDRILCQFEKLSQISSESKQPIFVFAHFMIPHHPYIFAKDGSKLTPSNLEFGNFGKIRDPNYLEQLQFANMKILHSIDEIIETSDVPPVIILQSDHGSIPPGNSDQQDKIREKMSNFNSYYFPSNGASVLYDDITPVNSFRLIFNHYFGYDYDLLKDESFWSVMNPFDSTPPYFENVSDLLSNSS